MSTFRSIFPGVDKPLIAMAHVPALPGTPLYDSAGGVEALVDHVRADVAMLVEAGFDAVMFCNENDRPYQLHAGPEASAVMARVVTECRPSAIPFGVDYLWDPRIALAAAVATGASFIREVVSGVWESDMGLWNTDAASVLRERRRLDAEDIAILMNISPEFASPIGTRTFAQVAHSTVVSSLADTILVSGPMAGAGPDPRVLREVREAVDPAVPVLLNTGAKAETIADMLQIADGCIVGSSLKVDGHTWNAVDPERAKRFVAAARKA
ncbi:BtpA/SgcQ family protein [Nocardioides sp.]|uniref:BtpA/SgcQ family protein n=1 Tax=Nocardioides sp. TaxID=35761 RepID=UPI00262299CD|nr:BtpA/SgcQ family protein [Nocardioides sp.]